ncbi:MAG: hypothetical protein HYX25_11360, partial [Candidatus Solibacter usitatus]|nr:hypothetical protein [Candidatus Solibacter usitatus]
AWPALPVAYIAVGTLMMGYGLVSNLVPSLAAFGTVGIGALVYRFGIRDGAERS